MSDLELLEDGDVVPAARLGCRGEPHHPGADDGDPHLVALLGWPRDEVAGAEDGAAGRVRDGVLPVEAVAVPLVERDYEAAESEETAIRVGPSAARARRRATPPSS